MFDQPPSVFTGGGSPLADAILRYTNQGLMPYAPAGGAVGEAATNAVVPYINDVLSGKVASQGVLNRPAYDPAQPFFAQVGPARDPDWWQQALDVALGIGPGTVRTPGQRLAGGADRMEALRLENEGITPNAMESGGFFQRLAQKPQPIRAYHGSPHDFDRFDMSKIGTGEGAQAYGHGLYFAEAEPVAWNYRYIGAPTGQNTGAASFARQAASIADEAGLSGDAARKHAIDILHAKAMRHDPSSRQMWFDAINNYDTLVGNTQAPGRMYEVNINADPSAFLQWDKPLSGQSAQVLKAVEAIGGDKWRQHAAQWSPPSWSDVAPGTAYNDAITGGTAYNSLAHDAGLRSTTRPGWPAQEAISAELQRAGIPGIRYLDQGSRGAGEGTNNYVLFDDSIIDILRKYGIAGLAAPGALSVPFSADAQTR